MKYPRDIDPDSGCRLPLPKREELDDFGKQIYDRLTDPKGGTLRGLKGPGGIQLHSLELSRHSRSLNHICAALGEGIAGEIIDIIKHRKPTSGLEEADAVVIELMGNYAGTAALLTAFDMQLNRSQAPPLPPL